MVVLLHAIRTACGIETRTSASLRLIAPDCMQSVPLAVLKLHLVDEPLEPVVLHAIRTACGIETGKTTNFQVGCPLYCMQSVPLAVLKHVVDDAVAEFGCHCMQSVPLAVLKL